MSTEEMSTEDQVRLPGGLAPLSRGSDLDPAVDVAHHPSGHSPRWSIHVPHDADDAVRAAAVREGVSPARWLRAAVEQRLVRGRVWPRWWSAEA